jgi:hypothetical protein
MQRGCHASPSLDFQILSRGADHARRGLRKRPDLTTKKIIALSANRRTLGTFGEYKPTAARGQALGVMAQKNALSYRVSRNRPAGWYWEVVSDRKIIDRGLAPTRAQARADAIKVVASHVVRQPEDSTPPFEGLKAIEKP